MTATTTTRSAESRRIGIAGPARVRAKRQLRRGFGLTVLLTMAAVLASVGAYALATAFA